MIKGNRIGSSLFSCFFADYASLAAESFEELQCLVTDFENACKERKLRLKSEKLR